MIIKTILIVTFLACLPQQIYSSIKDRYCGDYNCYELLNVQQQATQKQIRDGFRKQSKKYHPDIVRARGGEDSTELFQRINNAYEVLGDKKTRESYNDYLQNPDKGEMYHYYRYYQTYYLPHTNPFVVLATFLTLLSGIQYASGKTMYKIAQNHVYNSLKFKNEVNNRFLEPDNNMSKEEITEELKKEVTIEGGWSEPKIKNILAIPENEQIELIEKKLWIKENFEKYQKEQQEKMEEQRKQFLQSGRGKKYTRFMKKYK